MDRKEKKKKATKLFSFLVMRSTAIGFLQFPIHCFIPGLFFEHESNYCNKFIKVKNMEIGTNKSITHKYR